MPSPRITAHSSKHSSVDQEAWRLPVAEGLMAQRGSHDGAILPAPQRSDIPDEPSCGCFEFFLVNLAQ
jgi:hypothetical protein